MSGVRTSAGYLFSSLILASGGGGAGGGAVVDGVGGGGAGGSSSVGDGKDGQSGAPGGYKDMTPGGSAGGGGTSLGTGSGANPGGEGVGGAGENAGQYKGGGGGGGAGFFGGGGGGAAKYGNNDGGGGGAGSSTSASSGGKATNTSYTRDTTGAPSVTFTFDLPATPGGGGGGGGGGGNGNGNGSSLALTSLKASPKAFVAADHGGSTGGTEGMTISYSNGVTGTTTFTVLAPRSGIKSRSGRCVKPAHGKHGKHCTRYVSVGSFTHTDNGGFNTFVFTGRVRHHKLRPGKYKLQAVSRANGQKSTPVTFSFRIAG